MTADLKGGESLKELNIEWRHFESGGETCLRCSETGKTLHKVIADFRHELKSKGIELNIKETILSASEMAQSNMILFNGVPLEDILDDTIISENYCPSCSCLTDSDTWCRTIVHESKTYEEIPEEVIRKAILKIIG
jgi:hypothetical protein